jgi:hypothetical protein
MAATYPRYNQLKKNAATLTDAAPVVIDATKGTVFYTVTITTSRTIGNPGAGMYDGQPMVLRIKNSAGGASTPTLTTGASNAFRYGTDVTALPAIATGKTLYVTCYYNDADDRWDVLGYSGGF